MRKQTGLFINIQVWEAYRKLCRRDKLKAFEPIEEFLKLALRRDSALAVLNMVQTVERAGAEGSEAYARVLLNWYKTGRFWVRVTDENESSVEHMLLHSLEDVRDPNLRKQIQQTLMMNPRKHRNTEHRREGSEKEALSSEPVAPTTSKQNRGNQKQIASCEMDAEKKKKILEKINQIREKLRSNKKSQTKKN